MHSVTPHVKGDVTVRASAVAATLVLAGYHVNSNALILK